MCAQQDSDQPAHSRSLIKLFVLRMKKLYPWLLLLRLVKIWHCANAQADLSLRWAHVRRCVFRLTFWFILCLLVYVHTSRKDVYLAFCLGKKARIVTGKKTLSETIWSTMHEKAPYIFSREGRPWSEYVDIVLVVYVNSSIGCHSGQCPEWPQYYCRRIEDIQIRLHGCARSSGFAVRIWIKGLFPTLCACTSFFISILGLSPMFATMNMWWQNFFWSLLFWSKACLVSLKRIVHI